MNVFKEYWLFFGSISLGISVWFLSYILLPLVPIEPILTETILFIISCYAAIILGFLIFKFQNPIKKPVIFNPQKTVKLLLIIIIVSYIIRWYDLFVIRNLSFNNDLKYNRILNAQNFPSNQILLIIASILKSLYFFPFVICSVSKLHVKKLYTILAYIVLLFPLIEAVLKGNRKPIFEIFIIIIFTVITYRRKAVNVKMIVFWMFMTILLLMFSMLILFKREKLSENIDNTFYESLFESRYNEILKPTNAAINYFKDGGNHEVLKLFAMSGLHTGQYITHGFFEFNHIMNMDSLPVGYGIYNFSTIPEFFNNTNLSTIEIANLSPREYVYLTQFGSFYIDFRWFTLCFMFIYGVIHKYVYQRSKQTFIYSPILIYFLIINVFLMILSYTRGAGVYLLFSFMFLLLLLRIFEKKLHEKSTNT